MGHLLVLMLLIKLPKKYYCITVELSRRQRGACFALSAKAVTRASGRL